MKNAVTIGGVARQIIKVCERIETMTMDMEGFESVSGNKMLDTYEQLRLDELEHLQTLTLSLTTLVLEAHSETAEESNADESAFFEGELNYKKGEAITPEEEGEA